MKIFKAFIGVFALAFLVGCSQQIPPAHVGKILTPNGYQPEVLPPSKVWIGFRENLVLVETGTATASEPLTIIMQDKLTLKADVRFRARIDSTRDDVLNSMFNDIVAEHGKVSLSKVYNTYGQMIVRNKSREVLSQYSVEDVHKNYARISGEIFQAVTAASKGLPIKITDVALGNIQFPETITRAAELAKERELQIAQEEAQVQIELTKKEGQKQLAEADYKIKMMQAKTVRDENRTIAEGITPDLLKLKSLEVQKELAKSGASTFVPYEVLTNPAFQVRAFQGK